MKTIIITVAFSFLFAGNAQSQGCVAIRNLAGFGQFAQLGYGQSTDKWMLDINNRYYEAWKFLQGKTNISPKDASDNAYIYAYTLNIGLSKVLRNGWSMGTRHAGFLQYIEQ